jgi:nucleotide-binding universal stress UspA family protein
MKNILVPTDLLDCSKNTLMYAINLSKISKTNLVFYHAASTNETTTNAEFTATIKELYNSIDFVFDENFIKIIIEKTKFTNKRIVSIVKEHEIDLVLMGTNVDNLKTTFFGSHVSELIDELDCPVLSIPHGYSNYFIDRIGYATELTDIKERLKEIVPFAKLFNASIEAFHVYPVFPQSVDVATYDVKTALNQLKSSNNYDKINLHFIKTAFDNEPVTGIREFLKSYKPDILVMCHKPKGLFDKLLLDSGTTHSVSKVSPIPLLALNQKTSCKIM